MIFCQRTVDKIVNFEFFFLVNDIDVFRINRYGNKAQLVFSFVIFRKISGPGVGYKVRLAGFVNERYSHSVSSATSRATVISHDVELVENQVR